MTHSKELEVKIVITIFYNKTIRVLDYAFFDRTPRNNDQSVLKIK